MKKATLFFAIALFAGLFASQSANAQALVINDGTVVFGIGETAVSTSLHFVESPNGNVTFWATFQLTEGNPLIPETGVSKVFFWTNVGGSLMYDAEAMIYSDGRVKALFHLNGSGDTTPNKG